MSMTQQKLESRAQVVARVRSEFDDYDDSVLLTELETSAPTGFSVHTLKFWRLSATEEKPTKGPPAVYLHGCVRYQVSAIRRWRERQTTAFNQGAHTRLLKAPREIPAKTIRRLTALGLEEL
jgi:hypothetical protein